MLHAYVLTVDITALDATIDEATFRELCTPCLSHLDSLKGAFDRKPSSITYYRPSDIHDNYEFWSVRAVVMISIGKVRSEYLIQLYQAIVRLIELELPDFGVRAEVSRW